MTSVSAHMLYSKEKNYNKEKELRDILTATSCSTFHLWILSDLQRQMRFITSNFTDGGSKPLHTFI